MNNMRDLKDFNIKTLKESFPMSSQVGLGEDFCIFDVRYDTIWRKTSLDHSGWKAISFCSV